MIFTALLRPFPQTVAGNQANMQCCHRTPTPPLPPDLRTGDGGLQGLLEALRL